MGPSATANATSNYVTLGVGDSRSIVQRRDANVAPKDIEMEARGPLGEVVADHGYGVSLSAELLGEGLGVEVLLGREAEWRTPQRRAW